MATYYFGCDGDGFGRVHREVPRKGPAREMGLLSEPLFLASFCDCWEFVSMLLFGRVVLFEYGEDATLFRIRLKGNGKKEIEKRG